MKTNFVCIACSIAVCILASNASAENGLWPVLSRGKSLTINKISDLPKSLQSTIGEHCGEPMDWEIEFFKTDDSSEFALLNCSFGFARASVVVKNDNGNPVAVNFVIGDQSTGYSVTKNLGVTSVDAATGMLSSTFETDSCGLGGEDPQYTFAYKSGDYVLVAIELFDCETKDVRKVWQAKEF